MPELREDIKTAFERMATKFGAKRAARNLERRLLPGEVVVEMQSGAYGGGTGLAVLTNKRFLIVRDDFTKQKFEDFPLDRIASVAWSSGALGGLTVSSVSNKVVVRTMDLVAGEQFADRLRSASRGSSCPSTTDAGAHDVGPDHALRLLSKLGELHEAGVLTDDEFGIKKAELLKRL